MGVYENEFDDTKNTTNISELFKQIIEILKTNVAHSLVEDDNHLLENITEYIFPYYEEIFSLVIPKLKILAENYFNFIINEHKYVEIMMILWKKASSDIE